VSTGLDVVDQLGIEPAPAGRVTQPHRLAGPGAVGDRHPVDGADVAVPVGQGRRVARRMHLSQTVPVGLDGIHALRGRPERLGEPGHERLGHLREGARGRQRRGDPLKLTLPGGDALRGDHRSDPLAELTRKIEGELVPSVESASPVDQAEQAHHLPVGDQRDEQPGRRPEGGPLRLVARRSGQQFRPDARCDERATGLVGRAQLRRCGERFSSEKLRRELGGSGGHRPVPPVVAPDPDRGEIG
jgi:hypothetical protein